VSFWVGSTIFLEEIGSGTVDVMIFPSFVALVLILIVCIPVRKLQV
jgi:hypothetical protein